MGTSEVILVGVDGSKESYAAVKWAAERSKVRDCRLHIICTYAVASYAAATLDGGYAVLDDAALKEGASQIVQQGVDLAREIGATNVHGVVEAGDPAGILIDMSKEVDLIVVGSRGGGGFADRLLGTVSSALPAHAKCPVVIVPRHTSGKGFTPVERIVVGSDGSEGATSALKRAIDEAELWDARLTAVAAVPMATGTAMMAWLPSNIDRDAMLKDVKEGLDAAVDQALGVLHNGGRLGFVGVPHYNNRALGSTFAQNITVAGGAASVTTYDKQILLKAVLDGDINPGKVFTSEYRLDEIDQAYKDMDERKTIKSMIVFD